MRTLISVVKIPGAVSAGCDRCPRDALYVVTKEQSREPLCLRHTVCEIREAEQKVEHHG